MEHTPKGDNISRFLHGGGGWVGKGKTIANSSVNERDNSLRYAVLELLVDEIFHAVVHMVISERTLRDESEIH